MNSFWKNLFLKAFNAEKQTDKLIRHIEIVIKKNLRKLKRKITAYAFSTTFLILSLGFISVGVALFLSRFVPIDLLLIVIGLIFLLIGILIALMN